MKKTLVLLMIALVTQVNAQNAKYMSAMEKNVAMLDTATTQATMQQVTNTFDRIRLAEPKEWLPPYYIAWLDVMMSMHEKDNKKKDSMLDHALMMVDMADSLSPDNSEIWAVRSFALSMKIGIDPAARGQKLGMESGVAVARAMKLDPENPRPYLLKGQSAMYTPVQYGGGKEAALPLLEKAVEKYKTFKPKSSIMPHWGAKRADEVLEQCRNME
jgi:hypothetical protein